MKWREYQQLQKVTRLDDRFVSYVERGGGPAVVLLHGIPAWGFLWEQQIDPLSETHRVLVPDLLGFGFSDRRDCFDRSIGKQAELIIRWLDAIGLEKVWVVGHDIGGGVALRMATLYPQRVTKLCLMNCVCYDSWPIELMLQFGHPEADRKLSASSAMRMLREALKQGFANSPSSDVLDGLLAPYRTEVGKQSLIRNASALNTNLTTEITSRLSQLQCDTRILWGKDDRFQLFKYAERLAWDIPDAELVPISDARHFVMLDQPDVVSDHLRSFAKK